MYSAETRESRYIEASHSSLRLEIRAGARTPLIRGVPIVFGQKSHDLGGFREVIHKSAMEFSLRERPDVFAYIAHDPARVLGRTKSGTLRLMLGDRQLECEIDPPDTTEAANVQESIRRGDVSGMSFRFWVPEGGDRWTWSAEDDTMIRDVYAMVVGEVSIVSEPAYPQTTVAVRSMERARAELRTKESLAMLQRRQRIASVG